MIRKSFWGWFWTIFTIFVIMTWVLWFFGIDIRDIKYRVKYAFSDVKANSEIQLNTQKTSSGAEVQPQKVANKEDELITKCKQSYEFCKEISTQKYDMSISLLKVEKFEEKVKAEEFYETWKGPLQIGLETELKLYNDYWNTPIESIFPLVLFASKVRGSQGALPVVLICSKEGELVKSSKGQLLCG